MIYPLCKNDSHDTQVLDMRTVGQFTLRRRECKTCQHRFTTKEIVTEQLKITKKDGTIEDFDDNKITRSILASCNNSTKREEIKKIIDYILEETLKNNLSKIHSKEIRKLILQKLKIINKIAYLRFASVYHKFTSVE